MGSVQVAGLSGESHQEQNMAASMQVSHQTYGSGCNYPPLP